jgi:LysM repeat protein
MAANRPSRWRAGGVLAGVLAIALAASASYTIRPGDTLLDISINTGVKVADLRASNPIPNPDRIYAGRTLTLGSAAPSTADSAETGGAQAASGGTGAQPVAAGDVTHQVVAGETLLTIANRYGVSIGAIARANGLASPHHIVAGTRLTIPGGGSGTAHAAAGTRGEVATLIERTAAQYGMSPAFVKAVAWQESGYNQQVVSRANAIGIMQVLPSTGQFVSNVLVGRPLDLNDAADNVEAGVAFLRYLYRHTGGDPHMTLAGYYQGLRSVNQNGMYTDTEQYIANVMALRERMR